MSDNTAPQDAMTIIEQNLACVLKSEAFDRWFTTPMAALDGKTPSEVIDAGDMQRIIRLTENYRNAVFS